MKLPTRRYPAKVILFGEYTVLIGGDILAVPYDQFYASWQMDENNIDGRLVEYITYLREQDFVGISLDKLIELEENVNRGAYLESNIKHGSGLGSSGSVVAAIYDCCKVSDGDNVEDLLETFVQMESYFHGKSSGIDPLVSYTQTVVHKSDRIKLYEEINLPTFTLYDSGIPRDTRTLVEGFKAELQNNQSFAGGINQISLLNNQLITAVLEGKWETESLITLSNLQFEVMADYIPDAVKPKWQSSPNAVWKICGAGGGGYFLKIAKE